MEKRVFGCSQFSDIVFRSSLTILEKILDYILEDQDSNHHDSKSENQSGNKVYKMGFFSSETTGKLVVMFEIFDNDQIY